MGAIALRSPYYRKDTAGTGAKRITEDIKGAIKDVGKKTKGLSST